MNIKENINLDLLSEDDALIQERFETIHKKIEQIKNYYQKKRKELKKQKDDDLDKLKEYLKTSGERLGRDISDDIAPAVQDELAEKGRRIRAVYLAKKTLLDRDEMTKLMRLRKYRIISKGTLAIAGFALSSALIHKAYTVYKNELKKAKNTCRQKTGKDRKECIELYKIQLLKKRFRLLNSLIVNCKEAKDPIKCRMAVEAEMSRVKNIINKELNKVGEELLSSGTFRELSS
jgi:hypothetical protein